MNDIDRFNNLSEAEKAFVMAFQYGRDYCGVNAPAFCSRHSYDYIPTYSAALVDNGYYTIVIPDASSELMKVLYAWSKCGWEPFKVRRVRSNDNNNITAVFLKYVRKGEYAGQ